MYAPLFRPASLCNILFILYPGRISLIILSNNVANS